ncbi:bifunctional phosphopantothenoylcysteine decarboxylase/phosphopantothenate--cysteine ligase CoaBC [Candidatus Peregrinibacteria bacterium]|nr:bifunctional phosphopantothenoylcysteine decarboxylase/phosphopantothenate--cysteine ligase CoaBC [Candidatus Peregrinibacteria bacterium]
MYLSGKKILLGVTASVALYKALDLIRLFKNEGATTTVVMTRGAKKCINPTVFAALSGNQVYFDEMPDDFSFPYAHLRLSEIHDIFIICPATANILGKMAHGIADNLLTTIFLGNQKPVLIVPAMNYRMWSNPMVQENVTKLQKVGCVFIGPDRGELACGDYGEGRLADFSFLLFCTKKIFAPQDFFGKRVLITGGPTQEPLDPVRHISSPSSGLMGFLLSEEALLRGADVTFIVGPSYILGPSGSFQKHFIHYDKVRVVSIQTAHEMYFQVKHFFPSSDIFISAASVSDYSLARSLKNKIKKDGKNRIFSLKENVDILKTIGKKKKKFQKIIGFALETEHGEFYAKKKMREKKLDIIVLNGKESFGAESGCFTLFTSSCKKEIGNITKFELARVLFDSLASLS